MDYKYIYNKGYKDHREELSQTDKAYLAGIKHTYEAIETFLDNADDVYEEIPKTEVDVFAKVKRTIRRTVLNDLRHWIRSEWYEAIVSMIDESEDGVKKENEEYVNPEPLSKENIGYEEE